MKYKLILLCLVLPVFIFAQNNTKKGVAAKCYDVVAYFSDTPTKGKKEFQSKHDGVSYRFASAKNKELFDNNPEKYIPQYGGWCAYAMGKNGDKVSINPKTYEIRDGKLYLFYNKFSINTLSRWLKENPEKLQSVADKNWDKVKN